jgi:hypothetical protein
MASESDMAKILARGFYRMGPKDFFEMACSYGDPVSWFIS